MECPYGGPQDDVIIFKFSAMADLTLYKLQPIIIASQMKLISARQCTLIIEQYKLINIYLIIINVTSIHKPILINTHIPRAHTTK